MMASTMVLRPFREKLRSAVENEPPCCCCCCLLDEDDEEDVEEQDEDGDGALLLVVLLLEFAWEDRTGCTRVLLFAEGVLTRVEVVDEATDEVDGDGDEGDGEGEVPVDEHDWLATAAAAMSWSMLFDLDDFMIRACCWGCKPRDDLP